MNLESQTKTIDTYDVTVQKLPAVRGSRLRVRLLKLVSPGLARLGELRGQTFDQVMGSNVSSLLPALVGIVTQLEDKVQDALMLEVFACTYVISTNSQGTKVKHELSSLSNLDQAFGSDVDSMWKAFAFTLEVNLGGFFDAIKKLAPGASLPLAPSS